MFETLSWSCSNSDLNSRMTISRLSFWDGLRNYRSCRNQTWVFRPVFLPSAQLYCSSCVVVSQNRSFWSLSCLFWSWKQSLRQFASTLHWKSELGRNVLAPAAILFPFHFIARLLVFGDHFLVQGQCGLALVPRVPSHEESDGYYGHTTYHFKVCSFYVLLQWRGKRKFTEQQVFNHRFWLLSRNINDALMEFLQEFRWKLLSWSISLQYLCFTIALGLSWRQNTNFSILSVERLLLCMFFEILPIVFTKGSEKYLFSFLGHFLYQGHHGGEFVLEEFYFSNLKVKHKPTGRYGADDHLCACFLVVVIFFKNLGHLFYRLNEICNVISNFDFPLMSVELQWFLEHWLNNSAPTSYGAHWCVVIFWWLLTIEICLLVWASEVSFCATGPSPWFLPSAP